ncbi:MAG: C13 family peptidase [Acidobacteriota bacterium]
MKKFSASLLILCVALCACVNAGEQSNQSTPEKPAQEKPQTKRATIDPNKFALVIAGVGGEESYTKKFTAQAMQLYDTLTNKLGFDEKQVYLLTENVVSAAENVAQGNFARATAEETRKAFAAIKAASKPEGLVFICLIGHGSAEAENPKFNLVGPDINAKEYAKLIGDLPTRRNIFVNTTSSSGDFIKPLSAENRIVLTATRSGNEQNATYFAEPFIKALTESAADTDKSGRISILEAFNFATKVTQDWYKQKTRLATEHALIDDNGDGTGHEQAGDGDGAIAKTTYLDSKSVEEAANDVEVIRLLEIKQQLEVDIEKLKARKPEMQVEEYETELERLLVELAKTNRQIKARKK